jgi:osmoprotectant transport system permease protein
VIATATIGAILGGGGLGRLIFDGMLQGVVGYPSLFAGAILVSALAIGVDLILAWVQRRLTPRALRAPRRDSASRPSSVVGGPDIASPATGGTA